MAFQRRFNFFKKDSNSKTKRPNDRPNSKKRQESPVATGLFPLAAPARGPRPELFSLADRWNPAPPRWAMLSSRWPLWTRSASKALPACRACYPSWNLLKHGHHFSRLSASSSRLPVPEVTFLRCRLESKSKSERDRG